MRDSQYENASFRMNEVKHRYGPNVHIVGNPYLLSLMATLGAKDTEQPQVNALVRTLYTELTVLMLNSEFPRRSATVPTRMIQHTPRGIFQGDVLDSQVRAISVNIARAGTLPSQVTYDLLNTILNPKLVRQDHIVMSRELDAAQQVVGSAVGGAKIGGDVDGAVLIFPDPMGATGSSLSTAISMYKSKVPGIMRKLIAVNLIVTPEYVKRMTTDHPDVIIFAIRLDRGMSSPEVLSSIPGTHPDLEKGLDDRQYIVPGAGGMGEVMNNAYV